jgi:excisionase family DNA binding protein
MYKDKESQENILRINTLLNAKQVAEILNTSKSKTYSFRQLGEIPNVRIGKSRRVRPKNLILYIKKQYIPGKPIIKRIER